MKKRAISVIVALGIAATLISSTAIPALALRGYNYVHIESPDGVVFPDLERFIELDSQSFYYNSTIVKMIVFGDDGFPSGFELPEKFDSAISSEYIKDLEASLQVAIDTVSEYGPDSQLLKDNKTMLDTVRKLESGEPWINAVFKMERSLAESREDTRYSSYGSYYDYYFQRLRMRLDDIGLDDDFKLSATDSLTDTGKRITENAKYPKNLFYYHSFDYMIEAVEATDGYITVIAYAKTDWGDGSGGNYLGTIKAYDAEDVEINPFSVSEEYYESDGEQIAEREHVFRIPVTTGDNYVRFTETDGPGNVGKRFGLTIVVGSGASKPAVEAKPSSPTVTGGYGSNGKFLAPIDPPAAGSIPISSRAELEAIKDNLGGSYHLVNDIDLSGAEWVPIGVYPTGDISYFRGTFDGQGNVIRNMRITEDYQYAVLSGNQYAGLFGIAVGAVIKNVGMDNTIISLTSSKSIQAGAICGAIHIDSHPESSFSISNCYNTGNILISSSEALFSSVGGICGNIVASLSSSINQCYNTGDISISTGSYSDDGFAVGGVFGRAECVQFSSLPSSFLINNCYNTGNILAVSTADIFAGGIGGKFHADASFSINNCYNTGDVTAGDSPSSSAGGIYGKATCFSHNNTSFSINNCYNLGETSASGHRAYAGGIGGCSYDYFSINNCINIGKVTASTRAGGIIGFGPVLNSQTTFSINSSYCTDFYGSEYGTQLPAAQMKDKASFVGFDFDSVWGIDPSINDGYPYLLAIPPSPDASGTNPEAGETPETEGPETIFTLERSEYTMYIGDEAYISGGLRAPALNQRLDKFKISCSDPDIEPCVYPFYIQLPGGDVINYSGGITVALNPTKTGTFAITIEIRGAAVQLNLTVLPVVNIHTPTTFVGSRNTLSVEIYSDAIDPRRDEFLFTSSDPALGFLSQPVIEEQTGDWISVSVDYSCKKEGYYYIDMTVGGISKRIEIYAWEWDKYWEKEIVRDANNWVSSMYGYFETLASQIQRDSGKQTVSKTDGDAVLSAASAKMSLTVDTINLTIPPEAREACKKAMLDMFISAPAFNNKIKSFSDIKTKDANKLASQIVTTVAGSFDTINFVKTYENGKYTIHIYGYKYSDAFTGSLTCTNNSALVKYPFTAGFSTSKDEMCRILSDYILQMTELAVDAYEIAFEEATRVLTGYASFPDYLSKNLNAQLKELGYGDINAALETCRKFYDYASKVFSLKNSNDLLSWAVGVENVAESFMFNDGTMVASVINGAYNKMLSYKDKLRNSAYAYSMGQTAYKGKADNLFNNSAFLISVFKCPVNVYVYDRLDNLIGSIEGNEIMCHSDVIILEKNGDIKRVLSKKSSEIMIRAVGTGYGSLNYTLDEYSDGALVGRANFFDIGLFEGKEVIANLYLSSLDDSAIKVSLISGGETINADEAFKAQDAKEITVKTEIKGNGFVSPNNAEYMSGDAITLIAVADDGYIFNGWYEGDTFMSPNALYTFTVVENVSLTARFLEASTSLYAITALITGGGFVTGEGMYEVGDKATLKAESFEGYVFDGWYDEDAKISGKTEYSLVVPEDDYTLEARFVPAGAGSTIDVKTIAVIAGIAVLAAGVSCLAIAIIIKKRKRTNLK